MDLTACFLQLTNQKRILGKADDCNLGSFDFFCQSDHGRDSQASPDEDGDASFLYRKTIAQSSTDPDCISNPGCSQFQSPLAHRAEYQPDLIACHLTDADGSGQQGGPILRVKIDEHAWSGAGCCFGRLDPDPKDPGGDFFQRDDPPLDHLVFFHERTSRNSCFMRSTAFLAA